MDNLLDFDEDNKMGDYLWVEKQDLPSLIHLLEDNHVDHRVREVKQSLDDHVVENYRIDDLLIFGVKYIVQIPPNLKDRVDDLLAEHPDVFNTSEAVRRYYLEEACDDDGLIEILLFPDDWEKGDAKLALELLHNRGVQPSPEDMERVRKSRNQIKAEEKNKAFQRLLLLGFVVLFCLLTAYYVIM